MERAILLEERSRRKNKKYNAEEITFRTRIDMDLLPERIKEEPMYYATDLLRQLFNTLIEKSTQHLRSFDLIRFYIQSDGLDKPISTNIMRVSDLTVEKILSCIIKVLQSKDEIHLDSTFTVDIITISLEIGGSRRKVINIDVDRLKKRSVLSIPGDELGLCCAKAIVFGLAHLEKDQPAINLLKDRRRSALFDRAVQLHRDAEVPLKPCTINEISMFETFLGIRIVVISAEKLNKVKKIYIYIYFVIVV